MTNFTQLTRYKKLVQFLEEKFKQNIDAKQIEDITFYSYRNINRIFSALHHETIGNYIKRRRLEKSAEYLKYSNKSVFDIALNIGYADIASFSKAFKKHFNCSPSNFRNSNYLKDEITQKTIDKSNSMNPQKIPFEIETIPKFQMLYLTFNGNYENIAGIEKIWNELLKYALKERLLNDETIFVAEILDDDEICETIQCRYNAGIILEESQTINPEGLFQTKTIDNQKYAKFIHKGSYESSMNTYNLIYSQWMTEIKLEFADKPILEFYPNDEGTTPDKDLITEIYIPIC